MKLIFKLMLLNFKYMVNVFLQSSETFLGLNFKNTIQNKKNINRSNIIIFLIIIYIFWFAVLATAQVFLHYVHLHHSKINIFLLVYVLISVSFFFGSTSNKEFNFFFLNGIFTLSRKKRLLVLNNFSFLVSTLVIIYILSLPIYVLQPILNGKNGFYFIINYIIIIGGLSTIFTFINTIVDFNFNKIVNGIKQYVYQILLISGLIVLGFNTMMIKKMILNIKKMILENSISHNIAHMFSRYDLYHINLGILTYLGIPLLVIVMYLLMNIIIRRYLKDNYDYKIRYFNLINISNKYFLSLKYLSRRNLIVNNNIFILTCFALLTLVFSQDININIQFVSVVISITIVNALFSIKNRYFFNYFFMLKIKMNQITYFIFLFSFCQFSLLSLIVYFSLNIPIFYFVTHFFLLGLFILYISSFLGLFLYKKLFVIYAENTPYKIIRYSIIFYGFITITLTQIFSLNIYILNVIILLILFIFININNKNYEVSN